MEFIADNPLSVLQALTALVSFAAGFTTYHFGLRRSGQRDHSGTGGQHGLVDQRRTSPAPRSSRPQRLPSAPRGLVGEAARSCSSRAPARGYALVA